MQAILIMLPILVYAFLTGIALGYVLAVLLPRLRRASVDRHDAPATGHTHGSPPAP